MHDLHLHIRRTRRTDFTAVMELLASSGIPVPPPDRASLRRFRNMVADLGADFHLAVVDGKLAGLVHVTYARHLTLGQCAVVNHLLVTTAFRRHGIGLALLEFVQSRGRRRGCATFSCPVPAVEVAARQLLERAGLQPSGEWFTKRLSPQ